MVALTNATEGVRLPINHLFQISKIEGALLTGYNHVIEYIWGA